VITVAAHICAALALGYLIATWRSARGWRSIDNARPPITLPGLSIIVPARNEERGIERCVRALLAQQHLTSFEVIVVDDQSSDRTADIVSRIAAEDERLRLVHGAPLPPKWVGKPWALDQASRIAGAPWLLFVDADTVVGRDGAASTLAFAIENGVDVVSILPAVETRTFWERAVIPSVYVAFPIAYGSTADFNDPRQTERAFLLGAYILVARQAYDEVGGHAAVRAELCEDMELALLFKKHGRFRTMFAGGMTLAGLRPYHSLQEIWGGFSKNWVTGARGNLLGIVVGSTLTFLLAVLPWAASAVAVTQGRMFEALEAFVSAALAMAGLAWSMSKAGLPIRLALYQPLGFLMIAIIGMSALIKVVSGRGVEWRGRRYTGRYKAILP
jgi:chlorobactene glucosyltransferase